MKSLSDIPKIKFKQTEQISGFEILDLHQLLTKDYSSEKHNPFTAHRINFYALLLNTKGEINHPVYFSTVKVKENECLLLAPGQVHAFNEAAQYHGFLILFTVAFVEQYVAQSTIKEVNQLFNYFNGINKLVIPDEGTQLIQGLINEFQTPSNFQQHVIGSILSTFLLRLASIKKDFVHVSYSRALDSFNNFRLLLEEQYKVSRDAKYYAHELGFSYKHLNQVCKDIVKKTAKEFIDDYIILEAKRHLAASKLSIKELSFQLGFDEPTNFLKYFKKQTQQTPLEFRKKLS